MRSLGNVVLGEAGSSALLPFDFVLLKVSLPPTVFDINATFLTPLFTVYTGCAFLEVVKILVVRYPVYRISNLELLVK